MLVDTGETRLSTPRYESANIYWRINLTGH